MSPTSSVVNESQTKARKLGREARAKMSDDARDLASEIIAEKVIHAHWFRRAEYIACYLPTANEVDTWTIIARAWRMKKRIFAPVIEKKRLMQFQEITPETTLRFGKYGLAEPDEGEVITARMLDVVLTPVVAFDSFDHRVGMGGGYFDRTFSFLKHRSSLYHPKLIGVAFACQKVEKITPNPWDIRLFRTITESD